MRARSGSAGCWRLPGRQPGKITGKDDVVKEVSRADSQQRGLERTAGRGSSRKQTVCASAILLKQDKLIVKSKPKYCWNAHHYKIQVDHSWKLMDNLGVLKMGDYALFVKSDRHSGDD